MKEFNTCLEIFRCCTDFLLASNALAPELSNLFRKAVCSFLFDFFTSMNTMCTRYIYYDLVCLLLFFWIKNSVELQLIERFKHFSKDLNCV